MRNRMLIALVAGLALVGPASADECAQSCARTRKACVVQAKSDRAAMRADCKDLGGQRTCFKEVNTIVKSALVDCREKTGQCQTCCGNGGGSVECSTGCSGEPLPSTWAGIQRIFQTHGCTDATCHGAGKAGGLDLSPNVAYENLLEVKSTASALARLTPGDERRSFLFLKLAKKTDPSRVPDGVEVGTAMPNGNLPALSADELQAISKWIYAGAPEKGTVNGTEELLGACLPAARPLRIKPLAAPRPGSGFQFRMPPFRLKAHSEVELCFATYYDISKQVPAEFSDSTGGSFVFNSQELRQDPQSHHLILNRYFGSLDDIHDPGFGKWTCIGGKKTGKPCKPTDLASCGKDGVCTSEIKSTFACIGYGPQGSGGRALIPIGGAQKAQAVTQFGNGVYAQLPSKGILYWNPHAFNLTDRDTVMHGWINYYFTNDKQYFVRNIFDTSRIFSGNAAPFTKQEICNTNVLPRGARLYELSSHTHRHGEYFWIKGPDDALLYENFVYNDPPAKRFDPPLEFDSADAAQRTLTYCVRYNNGLKEDGSYDTELVTRASRVPPGAPAFSKCKPVACVAGKVAAACTTNADCDSTPGAGDGNCDACRITGGESTENEMNILIGGYYVVPVQ